MVQFVNTSFDAFVLFLCAACEWVIIVVYQLAACALLLLLLLSVGVRLNAQRLFSLEEITKRSDRYMNEALVRQRTGTNTLLLLTTPHSTLISEPTGEWKDAGERGWRDGWGGMRVCSTFLEYQTVAYLTLVSFVKRSDSLFCVYQNVRKPNRSHYTPRILSTRMYYRQQNW